MIKQKNIIIAVGGTGGHVFRYKSSRTLTNINFKVEIVNDKRGFKYLEKVKTFKISILPSSPLVLNSILLFFFSSVLSHSILRSLIFLIFNRPKIIIGMGGYASFPISLAAYILRIKFIIYENNSIMEKPINIYYLSQVKYSFNKSLKGYQKISSKIFEIGNIIKKEIINFLAKIIRRCKKIKHISSRR